MALQARIKLAAERQTPIDENDAKQAAHLFRVHGALLLENALPIGLIDNIRQYFMDEYAILDRASVESRYLKVGIERFMFSPHLKPPLMDPAIYAAPRILPVLHQLLGDDCIIQSVSVVCAFPGAAVQHVHRDHPQLFAEAGGLNAFFPPYALNVAIPLIDLDEETGTTAVWEGSHRIKSRAEETRYSKPEMEALKGAVLPWPKRGDAYLVDYRLRHTGTANTSDQPRPIIYIVFSRRWFDDRKNFDMQSPLLINRNEQERIPN